ncbi:type II secretion system F family protein, partial [Candidatus Peregrinibacteria bacterium]|nr:type II secretion system F family protein [Candidatus Peregrinibacteria bacterium]
MPKQAKDFLVEAALGDKKYDLSQGQTPAASDDQIVLNIEAGATPVATLREAAKKQAGAPKSVFARMDEAIRSFGKPKAKDKATFFRLMSIMINAGIPLIRSLDTITEQTENQRLKKAIQEIARDLEKGGTLSESMAKYPDIFHEAQLGLIRSGEASGQLNQILKQLAIEVEKSAAIVRKVRGAMMYPAFIVVVMIGVISALMIFVIPKITGIFAESGAELPALTRGVMAVSNFMIHQWLLLILGVFGLIFGSAAARKTARGKFAFDWLILHFP